MSGIKLGDPIWYGLPSKERIQEIKRRYFWDEFGKYGPRGRLYLDGKPYLEPKDDTVPERSQTFPDGL